MYIISHTQSHFSGYTSVAWVIQWTPLLITACIR